METTATTSTKKAPTKTDMIRTALKAAGIKRNAVSVRGDHNSIHCVIKSADVAYKVVADAAYAHRKIHYCEYSGEILSGGNTYVNVEYHEDVVDVPDVHTAMCVTLSPRNDIAAHQLVAAARKAGLL